MPMEKQSAHTPGPWRVADEHPGGVLDRCVMAGEYYVATVHDTARGSWDADARLIAAAPDLLAAATPFDIPWIDHPVLSNELKIEITVAGTSHLSFVTVGELRALRAALSRATSPAE